jgi:putative ABC transport system ATP-binding protein
MIVELLGELSHSDSTTVIVVTHDQSVAQRADIQFRLEDGQLATT